MAFHVYIPLLIGFISKVAKTFLTHYFFKPIKQNISIKIFICQIQIHPLCKKMTINVIAFSDGFRWIYHNS